MKKIIDYILVTESLLKYLDERVCKLIKAGFQPYGFLQVFQTENEYARTQITFVQAMVKYEEDSEQKE